jgi:hypothetical protein
VADLATAAHLTDSPQSQTLLISIADMSMQGIEALRLLASYRRSKRVGSSKFPFVPAHQRPMSNFLISGSLFTEEGSYQTPFSSLNSSFIGFEDDDESIERPDSRYGATMAGWSSFTPDLNIVKTALPSELETGNGSEQMKDIC